MTAPLKREAAEYAVTRSPVVEALGVANTLIGGPDGWHAVNTDVPGAVDALRERGIDAVTSVRFLGGGATVRLAAPRGPCAGRIRDRSMGAGSGEIP